MLFELVTGERFLPGDSFVELIMALVHVEEHLDRVHLLDAHRPGLGELTRRCLREDPEARWPDARALLQALDSGAAPAPVTRAVPRRPPLWAPKCHRRAPAGPWSGAQ